MPNKVRIKQKVITLTTTILDSTTTTTMDSASYIMDDTGIVMGGPIDPSPNISIR